jgi:hypothetical protein
MIRFIYFLENTRLMTYLFILWDYIMGIMGIMIINILWYYYDLVVLNTFICICN